VNPFSIQASVTKYSDGGVSPPAVADISNGGDEVVPGNAAKDVCSHQQQGVAKA